MHFYPSFSPPALGVFDDIVVRMKCGAVGPDVNYIIPPTMLVRLPFERRAKILLKPTQCGLRPASLVRIKFMGAITCVFSVPTFVVHFAEG